MSCVQEPTVGSTSVIEIECADCGRIRWLKPHDLYRSRAKVTPQTTIRQLGLKLFCTGCRGEGMPGRNISLSPRFVSSNARIYADAHMINSREARA